MTKSKFGAVLMATHAGPSFAVALFTTLLTLGSPTTFLRSSMVGAAILFQQFSVGLSNDWLDAKKDILANRQDKPVVRGTVTAGLLRFWSVFFALGALVVAAMLGPGPGIFMVFMLVVGWAYNLGMKSNWTSAIPYTLGFGGLPIFAGLSAAVPYWPAAWLVLVAALLGVSAHFANVLPDIAADKLTGVNALPHILGPIKSTFVIVVCSLIATLLLVSQSKALPVWVAMSGLVVVLGLLAVAATLALKPNPPRIIFPLLVITSFVNVLLFVIGTLSF